MPQKTYYPETSAVDAQRRWHHLDADGAVLGRLATRAATLLKGKHKPIFTPAIDCGDFVVVTNAGKVRLTGNKLEQKEYFSHSGWPKGAKVTPVKRVLERDPRKVVQLAVKRMLDPNRFRSRQMKRLKIYPGGEHPHAPQFAAARSFSPAAPAALGAAGAGAESVPPAAAAAEAARAEAPTSNDKG